MNKAETDSDKQVLVSALNYFRCVLDSDIEDFLRQKAINYENRNWCRTYLILDEKAFIDGEIRIEAYFTLSHKTLTAPETISNSLAKRLNSGIIKETIPFVLIGQLGKRIVSESDFSFITAREILDYAFEVIYASHELIPCTNVLVECRDELKKIYTDYGFSFFQNDGHFNQFYKIIK